MPDLRSLRINSAVHRYKYKNLQTSFFDPTLIADILPNAGAATTKGIEIDFTYRPAAFDGEFPNGMGYRLNGTLSYSSSYETGQEVIPGQRQSRYATIDAGVAIITADKRWELAFIGSNLTDKLYSLYVSQAPGSGNDALGIKSDLTSVVNRGRQLMVR